MKRRTFLKALSAMGAIAPLTTPNLARSQGTNVLKFVPQADLGVLDSVFTTAYVTRNHAFLVFDTLYGMTEAYEPQPQMVEGHSIENDGKLWTLKLRGGLKFHDGQPVLARDAVASIKRWAERDALGGSLLAATDELSAASDREIRFRLKKPFPLLPLALGRGSNTMAPIMPERLAMTPPSQQVTEMVGSGPYRFIAGERVPGSLAVYQRFEGYVPRPTGTPSFTAGPKIANVERIEWHVIPDAATAAAALQAGEVDWWEQPTADLLPLLKRSSAIKTEIIDRAGNIGLMRLYCLYPPFDNPAVKHALLGAIN
jgi:peptide/nickel transport system substrate-binding protein